MKNQSILRRIWELGRRDPSAWILVLANVVTVIEIVRRGDPLAAVLIVYWLQLVIIGLWAIPKIILVTRRAAFLWAPIFAIPYFGVLNIFGIVAGGLIDNQMQGTDWHRQFTLTPYIFLCLAFFIAHGMSFFLNFLRRREYVGSQAEDQIFNPMMRVFPMAFVALVGGFFVAFFDNADALLVFIFPTKVALDLMTHSIEHDEERTFSMLRDLLSWLKARKR